MTTETRAPRTSLCWWCARALRVDDADAHRVIVGADTEWICGSCWEKADVGPDVPLSYEAIEGTCDDDRH